MKPSTILRRCVACKQLLDRQQLWRIIRDHQNGIVLNEGMGRSAYLCPNENCFIEALRRKRIQKALRCKIPESILESLQMRLSQSNDLANKSR